MLTALRKIFSPDAGQNYALTTHLAATANSVEEALVKAGNYGVGTTAQMNAALGDFNNGALWYNTTTNSEWRRISGSWVNQDTGTVDIPLNSPVSGLLRVRRVGDLVSFPQVSLQSGGVANGFVVGTIPERFKPGGDVSSAYVPLVANSGSGVQAWLDLPTVGNDIRMFHYNTMATTYIRGSASYLTNRPM